MIHISNKNTIFAGEWAVISSQFVMTSRAKRPKHEGDDFMFEVTRDELSRCQIGTMNIKQGNSTSKASCMKHSVTTLR